MIILLFLLLFTLQHTRIISFEQSLFASHLISRIFLKLRWAVPTFGVKVIMQTVVTEINFYFYKVEFVGFYIIYSSEYCARRAWGGLKFEMRSIRRHDEKLACVLYTRLDLLTPYKKKKLKIVIENLIKIT